MGQMSGTYRDHLENSKLESFCTYLGYYYYGFKSKAKMISIVRCCLPNEI